MDREASVDSLGSMAQQPHTRGGNPDKCRQCCCHSGLPWPTVGRQPDAPVWPSGGGGLGFWLWLQTHTSTLLHCPSCCRGQVAHPVTQTSTCMMSRPCCSPCLFSPSAQDCYTPAPSCRPGSNSKLELTQLPPPRAPGPNPVCRAQSLATPSSVRQLPTASFCTAWWVMSEPCCPASSPQVHQDLPRQHPLGSRAFCAEAHVGAEAAKGTHPDSPHPRLEGIGGRSHGCSVLPQAPPGSPPPPQKAVPPDSPRWSTGLVDKALGLEVVLHRDDQGQVASSQGAQDADTEGTTQALITHRYSGDPTPVYPPPVSARLCP